MSRIALILSGIIYAALGIWCGIDPEFTSNAVGYQLQDPIGYSEFHTVYSGLEVGMGLAMLICAFRQRWRPGALAFSAIFSWAIVLFRTCSLWTLGWIPDFLFLVVAEWFIAILLSLGLWSEAKVK